MKVIVPVNMEKAMLNSNLTDTNPPEWNAGATYVAGSTATYKGAVYVTIQDHSGKYPDREPEHWTLVHTATPAPWSDAASYAVGDSVRYKRNIWRSVKADNRGYVPGTDQEWWQTFGPVNSWAAFDSAINTKSAALNELHVELDFSGCNALALFGLEGSTVSIKLTDGRGEVIDARSWSLAGLDARGWLEYFLDRRTPRVELVHTAFPLMAYSRLTLTVSAPGGIARLGHVVVGRAKFIGATLYDAEAGIADYSRKSTDDFGNTYLSVGNWAKETRLDLHIWNDEFDDIYRTMSSLRATPTVYQGDNNDKGFDSLTVWGFFRDFRMVIKGPTASQCALEIQGLI